MRHSLGPDLVNASKTSPKAVGNPRWSTFQVARNMIKRASDRSSRRHARKKTDSRLILDGSGSASISLTLHTTSTTKDAQKGKQKLARRAAQAHGSNQTSDSSVSSDATIRPPPNYPCSSALPAVSVDPSRLPSTFTLGPHYEPEDEPSAFFFSPTYSYGDGDSEPCVLPSTREPSLALPDQWSAHHDQAICMMDARVDCCPCLITRNIKRSYPELAKTRLTPDMVDKRLRVLDQNVYVEYWGLALEMDEITRKGKENAGKGSVDGISVLELSPTRFRRDVPLPGLKTTRTMRSGRVFVS